MIGSAHPHMFPLINKSIDSYFGLEALDLELSAHK